MSEAAVPYGIESTAYKKLFISNGKSFGMKKIINIMLLTMASAMSFANKNDGARSPARNATESKVRVVASTSWTAAFADIAGADGVETIAPANLRHPPEYEVTVSDIQKIAASDFFVYAGFERMMKTLGASVGGTQMIRITNNNSIAAVTGETAKIAEKLGTQEENKARLALYVKAIREAKAEIERRGSANAKVLCHKHQRYLAADLGLAVAATFGPEAVTANQIADAKAGGYDIIIDNVHNPVGSPLAEVAPKAAYVVWRNFPDRVERNALLHVVQENIAALIKAL